MRRSRRHIASSVTSHSVGDEGHAGKKTKNVTYRIHGELTGTVRLVEQKGSNTKRQKTAKRHSVDKKSDPNLDDPRYTSAFVIYSNINHVTRNRHNTIPPLSSAVLPMSMDHLHPDKCKCTSKHSKYNKRPKVVPHSCVDTEEDSSPKKTPKGKVRPSNVRPKVNVKTKPKASQISYTHTGKQRNKAIQRNYTSKLAKSSTKTRSKRTKKVSQSSFYDGGSDVETLISTENARCRRRCCRSPVVSDTDDSIQELSNLSVIARCSCQNDVSSTDRPARKKVSRSAPVFKMTSKDQFGYSNNKAVKEEANADVNKTVANQTVFIEKVITIKSKSACTNSLRKKQLEDSYKTRSKKKAMSICGIDKSRTFTQEDTVPPTTPTTAGQNDCNFINSESSSSENRSPLRIDVELPVCMSSSPRTGSWLKSPRGSSSPTSKETVSDTAPTDKSEMSMSDKSSVLDRPGTAIPDKSSISTVEMPTSATNFTSTTLMPTISITEAPEIIKCDEVVITNKSEGQENTDILKLPPSSSEIKAARHDSDLSEQIVETDESGENSVTETDTINQGTGNKWDISGCTNDHSVDDIKEASRPGVMGIEEPHASKLEEKGKAMITLTLNQRPLEEGSMSYSNKSTTGQPYVEGTVHVEKESGINQDIKGRTEDGKITTTADYVKSIPKNAEHLCEQQETELDTKAKGKGDIDTTSESSALSVSDFLTSIESAGAEHDSDTDISERVLSSGRSG